MNKRNLISEFEKVVKVCRVTCELYHQQKQNNLSPFDVRCCVDKSLKKKPATTYQQSIKEPFFSSSRTCRISSGEGLFKQGCNKGRRETSLSCCYYEIGNVSKSVGDHDYQVVTERVLENKRKCYDLKDKNFVYLDELMKEKFSGKKRNYYDPEDKNFEYGDQVVKENLLEKKRKCYGLKDKKIECSEKKEKKPRTDNKLRYKVEGTAPLPLKFTNEIQRLGGNDVKLLIQKSLTATDLNTKENRLNIPINQIREEAKDFLTEAEKTDLEKHDAKDKKGKVQVPLLEPNLNKSYIDFKKWDVSKSPWYVLCGSWNAVQKSNHLQVGSDLQMWSFRVNGNLNLALVNIPLIDPTIIVSSSDQPEGGSKD